MVALGVSKLVYLRSHKNQLKQFTYSSDSSQYFIKINTGKTLEGICYGARERFRPSTEKKEKQIIVIRKCADQVPGTCWVCPIFEHAGNKRRPVTGVYFEESTSKGTSRRKINKEEADTLSKDGIPTATIYLRKVPEDFETE